MDDIFSHTWSSCQGNRNYLDNVLHSTLLTSRPDQFKGNRFDRGNKTSKIFTDKFRDPSRDMLTAVLDTEIIKPDGIMNVQVGNEEGFTKPNQFIALKFFANAEISLITDSFKEQDPV